ncbi:hypothetical protein K1X13_02275 [Nocardioides sp. WL0053]|jgi:hypothetical protein|uniref:Uncharacterized protein n=1 Tax=Nocardioides jiangsuensis TaxID=2866161 RepID=A0ABS7RF32_9ACTN|nr:hypothetical protein [Nocardioides jiangsuensis]MBY9073639.1 hypothetical protein [Nocardioides jiangsuensis]
MKRLGAILATAALAAAPVLVVAAPASADTPGCVTKTEFKKVREGWSIKRVHNTFDTAGKQSMFMSGYQSREYKACVKPSWSIIMVDYEKKAGVWRVSSKMAMWG